MASGLTVDRLTRNIEDALTKLQELRGDAETLLLYAQQNKITLNKNELQRTIYRLQVAQADTAAAWGGAKLAKGHEQP